MTRAVGAEESYVSGYQPCVLLLGGRGPTVLEVKRRMECSLIRSLWIEMRLQSVVSASGYTSGPRRKNAFMFIHLLELDNVP